MRPPSFHPSTALTVLLIASSVPARTYLVAPDGSGTACTRSEPCALSTGAALALAGDTVVLMDGTYYEPLNPENSGRADAWITFRADDCALPIIEGAGETFVANEQGQAPSGVYSNTGTHLRFIGIASRYWDSGFTNGWTGEGTTNSNGHFQYINCIGEGNGRTGFVLYSAPGLTVRECISAHNGGSPTNSWSSGIQLYAVQGTPEQNVIERNVSFENTDAQKNNDGSGFIVDEHTLGATFINNIAFRNGGSCMRLTRSSNTRMINFSCYHNGMNPDANSPTNPGEFYFTDQQSRDTATLINTLAAASGSETDPEVFRFPPDSGLSNNLTVDSGLTPFYSDPQGLNPDFRPPASAAPQVENQGAPNGGPEVDIGFDPKCIVRRDPQVPYQKSWWTHAIDYDYIRSIGGIAKCFNPKQRAGGVDLGAYELSGEPHQFAQPGSCVPNHDDESEIEVPGPSGESPSGTGGSADMGDTPSNGGTPNSTGDVPSSTGGTPANAPTDGGAANSSPVQATATTTDTAPVPTVEPTTSSPTPPEPGAETPPVNGPAPQTPAAGGSTALEPGVHDGDTAANAPSAGCTCRITGLRTSSTNGVWVTLLGAAALWLRRWQPRGVTRARRAA